jgi:hypothetical protein
MFRAAYAEKNFYLDRGWHLTSQVPFFSLRNLPLEVPLMNGSKILPILLGGFLEGDCSGNEGHAQSECGEPGPTSG